MKRYVWLVVSHSNIIHPYFLPLFISRPREVREKIMIFGTETWWFIKMPVDGSKWQAQAIIITLLI